MNRHPHAMSRDEVLTELLEINLRTAERAGMRITSLPDQDLRELLVLARFRRWKDEREATPA
jgi:hypothetical protein